jgi:hypothetical protein
MRKRTARTRREDAMLTRKATHEVMNSDPADDDVGRVIRFRPRMGKAPRNHWRDPSLHDSGRHYSPVPGLAKYECPESEEEYRHRMMTNAIAFVFTSLLILAGVWLANNMMVHA